MHIPTPLKFIAAALVFATTAAVLFGRTPDTNPKEKSLRPESEILIRTSKLRPYFNVKLKHEDELSSSPGREITLSALIETGKNIPTLYYKWVLPDGIDADPATRLEGTIPQISAREGYSWNAKFINNSSKNEKIHLRVWINDESGSLINSAQYNTLIQNEIDEQRSELIKRQNEYLDDPSQFIKKFK